MESSFFSLNPAFSLGFVSLDSLHRVGKFSRSPLDLNCLFFFFPFAITIICIRSVMSDFAL